MATGIRKAVNMSPVQLSIEKEAEEQTGKLVRDHLSSAMLTKALEKIFEIPEMTYARCLPSPYPPCDTDDVDLQLTAVMDLRLKTHHVGEMVILRIIHHDFFNELISIIAEDLRGTAVYVDMLSHSDEMIVAYKENLSIDCVFIVKQPYLEIIADQLNCIRVCHPGDVVWLEPNDSRIPSRWQTGLSTTEVGTSAELRARGNIAYDEKKWAQAYRFYSAAIRSATTTAEKQIAHRNRALCNLKQLRPAEALEDARLAYDRTAPSEKGLFREAQALYELGKFTECLETLQALIQLYPDNKEAKQWLDRVKARLHEQKTGEYSFSRMYEQAEVAPHLVDCATYSSPVEIRPSSIGCGNGLFVKASVSAGQLLLCEKAFAHMDAREGKTAVVVAPEGDRIVVMASSPLFTRILQKAYHDPEALQLLNGLYHGNEHASPGVSWVGGHPVVDMFRMARITRLNTCCSPKTTVSGFRAQLGKSGEPKEDQHDYDGLWLLASRMNHSCVANCKWSFIGDMMIVRATKDLEAGTELLVAYGDTFDAHPYEKFQKKMSGWGFVCACELCKDRKMTGEADLDKRRLLFSVATGVSAHRGPDGRPNVFAATDVLKQLEETYVSSRTASEHAPRQVLCTSYCCLGFNLVAFDPLQAIHIIAKGLEYIGFTFSMKLPEGKEVEPNDTSFEVTRWGIHSEPVPLAFMTLFRAFRMISFDLTATMRRYVRIAYMNSVGEDETVYHSFPDLR